MLSATYSPADIAERWGCKVDKPLALINAKELIAFDVSSKGSKKRRWRITQESLDDFERRRSTGIKAKTTVQRVRKRRDPAEYQYF